MNKKMWNYLQKKLTVRDDMVFEAKFKDSQNVQKFMEKLLFTFLNIIS